jgi:hypothetical protein
MFLVGITASACTFPTIAFNEKKNPVTFECRIYNLGGSESPSTVAISGEKSTLIINWNPKNFKFGEKWSPKRRCEEVSTRFQTLHERDGLKYLTADSAAWLDDTVNVICGVKEEGDRCQQSDLLFTLESKDDPNEVLNELIALREQPKENKPLTRGSNFDGGRRIYYDLSKELENLGDAKPSDQKEAF